MKRRLAAILVGDVVGYSAMMEADEEGTAARIAELTMMVQEKVKARDGRVFKTMGDAVLADFASSIQMQKGDFEASKKYHEKAMELSPNHAYIKGRSAAFYTFFGKPERALELLDEAEGLDPYLPVWCLEKLAFPSDADVCAKGSRPYLFGICLPSLKM